MNRNRRAVHDPGEVIMDFDQRGVGMRIDIRGQSVEGLAKEDGARPTLAVARGNTPGFAAALEQAVNPAARGGVTLGHLIDRSVTGIAGGQDTNAEIGRVCAHVLVIDRIHNCLQ